MSEPLILPLTGLKCDGCVRSLTRALEASPAIETATVTLDPPQVYIIFSGPPLSWEECIALIKKSGFDIA
ncbi:cation transporter [Acetobacteraceae bacterium B3987]|nr:cation transporter [Acetobacteraceae bacterium B3987]